MIPGRICEKDGGFSAVWAASRATEAICMEAHRQKIRLGPARSRGGHTCWLLLVYIEVTGGMHASLGT